MISRIKQYIHNYNSARELSRYKNRINESVNSGSVDEVVSLIFDEPYKRFFWIKQVREEFTLLCQYVHNLKPGTVLEIGTANGGSLFAFTKLASRNAKLYSIDLPGGNFGGGYPGYRSAFYKGFKTREQQIELLRCDSHDPETARALKSMLEENQIDFLFIDGDHTYEGVKKDFTLYAPLVRKGGLIALHDIAQHPASWNVEVQRFWNELKLKFETREIINNKDQGWAGIGLILNFDPKAI